MAYATTAELRAHLDITSSAKDTQLGMALAAAERQVNAFCGRAFDVASGSSARVFRPDTPQVVWFDDATAVTLIETRSEGAATWTTLAASHYELVPLNGRMHGETWPYYGARLHGVARLPMGRTSTVRVTGTWGWAAVPDDVKFATLLQAAHEFTRTNSPSGFLGLDADAVTLLQPFRRDELWASV